MNDHIELPHVQWLTDWKRVGVEHHAQVDYVKAELKRIQEEGEPVLFAVLTAPLEIQRILALRILNDRASPLGDTWTVRLRPGCVPPNLDPQGRPVPPAKQGQLIAKVGTIGGSANTQIDGEAQVSGFTGSALRAASYSGQDVNVYRTIPAWGITLNTPQAISVLSRWGTGIIQPRVRRRNGPRACDQWLVVEVCDVWNDLLGPVPPPPPREPSKAQKAKPVKQAEAA